MKMFEAIRVKIIILKTKLSPKGEEPGTVRVTERLLELQDSRNWRLRNAAFRQLKKQIHNIKSCADKELLLNKLFCYDWYMGSSSRQASAWALGELNELRAAGLLIALLKDEDLLVQRAAATALGKLKDPRAVEPLAHVLAENWFDSQVHEAAAYALGEIGDPRAAAALIPLLEHDNNMVRSAAVWALTNIGGQDTAGQLIKALGKKTPDVRLLAAKALHDIGETKWMNIIHGNNGDFMRLGACSDSRALEPLVSALGENRSLEILEAAVKALGELKDPRAAEPLVRMLGGEYWAVGKAAAMALKAIDHPRLAELLISKLDDESPRVRQYAALALGEREDPRAVEPLIRKLGDPDKSVREESATALGKIKDPRAVEPLIERLGDPDKSVIARVIYALGAMQDPRAEEPLIRMLDDMERNIRCKYDGIDNSDLRSLIADALGETGSQKSVGILIRTLGDVNGYARVNAANSLDKLREPQWKELIKGDQEDFGRLQMCGDARAASAVEYGLRQWKTLLGQEVLYHYRSEAAAELIRIARLFPELPVLDAATRDVIYGPHNDFSYSSDCSAHVDAGGIGLSPGE